MFVVAWYDGGKLYIYFSCFESVRACFVSILRPTGVRNVMPFGSESPPGEYTLMDASNKNKNNTCVRHLR